MTRAAVLLCCVVLGVAACKLLLPERFAVNAPMLPMLLGYSVEPPSTALLSERMVVPAGMVLERFADELPGARFMRVTSRGDLLVSQPRAGGVVLLRADADGDGISDGRAELLSELNRPHGLALRDGWLYVAETDAVGRTRFDADARAVSGAYERVVTGLPGGGNHWSRTVGFGPDGWMYVSIGSSCNVCEEDDPRRAAIVRYRPDGSDEQLHATGLRNAVGFDWRPATGEMFATDNGRDLLGDDFPPCELNRVEPGGFYGWPYANGFGDPDPDLGPGHGAQIARSIAPVHGFRAHNAPLGITFLRHPSHGELRGAALVALHGSWNRTRKDGYRVVSLHWRDDGSIEERDFLSGFELEEDVIGRPVDVVEDDNGHVYVSDDHAGVVYRLRRGAAPPGSTGLAVPAPATPGPVAIDAAAATRGERLWEQHDCARCHDAARAAVAGRPLAGLRARHDVAGLVALLRTPPAAMPPVALEAGGRRDLAHYLLQRFP